MEQALADEAGLVEGLVRVSSAPHSPTKETDAQHPRSARGKEIPDFVPDYVTLPWGDAELLWRRLGVVRFGLGALDAASFDDHRLRPDAERRKRGVDLGSSADVAIPCVTAVPRSSARSSTAPGSGRRRGSTSRKIWP